MTRVSAICAAALAGALAAVAATGEARAQSEEDDGLTLGLFAPSAPFRGPSDRLEYVAELADHVAGAIGRKVVGRVYATPADFARAIKRGQVQLAVVDAAFVASRRQPGRVLAIAEHAGSPASPWRLVAGRDVHTLADLAGKTVVIPKLGSYKGQFVHRVLLDNEVSATYFRAIQEAPDAGSAVTIVKVGRADAAFVPNASPVPPELRVVATLDPIPWPVFLALPGFDEALIARTETSLLNFKNNGALTGFAGVEASGYAQLPRRFARPERRGPMAYPKLTPSGLTEVLGPREFDIGAVDLALIEQAAEVSE